MNKTKIKLPRTAFKNQKRFEEAQSNIFMENCGSIDTNETKDLFYAVAQLVSHIIENNDCDRFVKSYLTIIIKNLKNHSAKACRIWA